MHPCGVPLTFPSHAAAVLPLHRAAPERLWLLPLVVGSCMPDAAYALRVSGHFAHSFWGAFAFCVPVGLATWVWLEALVLPALRLAIHGPRGEALLRTRGLPATAVGWAWAAIALSLGALTHVVWDGFTHADGWPGRVLYGDARIEAVGLTVANALQYGSTIVGAVVVAAWFARLHRGTGGELSISAHRAAVLAACAVAGAIGSCLLHLQDFYGVGWKHSVWLTFFLGARGIAFGLTPACAAILTAAAVRVHRPPTAE